ncbi:hypothetical protein U9M48_024813, partial [Paspalum notatum var. saurae]
ALHHNNKEIGAKLLLVLWRTWFVRNELTHSPRQLAIQNSVRFLTDYWETLAGWAKINVDDAFMERTGKGGIGVIIGYDSGGIVLTTWKVLFNASNAKEVEALA